MQFIAAIFLGLATFKLAKCFFNNDNQYEEEVTTYYYTPPPYQISDSVWPTGHQSPQIIEYDDAVDFNSDDNIVYETTEYVTRDMFGNEYQVEEYKTYTNQPNIKRNKTKKHLNNRQRVLNNERNDYERSAALNQVTNYDGPQNDYERVWKNNTGNNNTTFPMNYNYPFNTFW